jgi:hypothetical protein
LKIEELLFCITKKKKENKRKQRHKALEDLNAMLTEKKKGLTISRYPLDFTASILIASN